MESEIIFTLSDPRATLEQAGGKGASLVRLSTAGLPVPQGFCVGTAAYRRFVTVNELQPSILQDLESADPSVPSTLEEASRRIRERFLQAPIPEALRQAVAAAYTSLPGTNPAVAVRSSATAEDLPEASFAGQQETYLNVCGTEAALEATRACWASLWTARAIGYRARQGIAPDDVALAVVVQVLVPAKAAGILFTANPVTGQRDQLLINAAWGLGEAIVGGLVTPDSYVVEKNTGRVVSQEIADKQVMTVRVDGGTVEQPVPKDLRRAPALTGGTLTELARLGERIEALYGTPMDIEWALAEGQKLSILQARPITALPEVQPATSVEWRMPDPKGFYMRGSVIDFMPDPLTPLFESLVVPSINTSITNLMVHLGIGKLEVFSNYLTSLNHYAYLSAGYSPRQMLQLLVRMIPALPRLFRNTTALWKEDTLPRYAGITAQWQARDPKTLSPAELAAGVREMSGAATDHLTSLQVATLGVAPGAEGVFTLVYNKLIKRRQGDPEAPVYLVGLESTPLRAEKALFDLANWCREHAGLADYLKQAPVDEIVRSLSKDSPLGEVDPSIWSEWRERFQAYLKRYGYAIYDLDFSKPLPMDGPTPLMETIRMYLNGQGRNPYERQQAMTERREAAIQAIEGRVRGLKRWAFRKSLNWAQSTLPPKEDSIAEIGLGYPVIRRLLSELGERFTRAGVITTAEDIYWLEYAELEQAAGALERGELLPNYTAAVPQRRAEWKALKRVTPPHQLPPNKKYMGMDTGKWLGVHAGNEAGSVIRGLGASPGQATAPARVLKGPEDFDEMRPGDVLVASITTPAWTPLFAMASAVVTDIGGPLSHGSIVAREYGIPAVLGTGVATKRIHSGQKITVDGARGVVTLLEE